MSCAAVIAAWSFCIDLDVGFRSLVSLDYLVVGIYACSVDTREFLQEGGNPLILTRQFYGTII